MKNKYVIVIYSKYTGEATHLGISYKTQEEAKAFAISNICENCNRYAIRTVPEHFTWQGRKFGFADFTKFEQVYP